MLVYIHVRVAVKKKKKKDSMGKIRLCLRSFSNYLKLFILDIHFFVAFLAQCLSKERVSSSLMNFKANK